MFTDTVTVDGAVPEFGLTDNQVLLSLALQVSVPPPPLDTLNVLFEGLAPPSMAEKLKLVGFTTNTGPPVTVNNPSSVLAEGLPSLNVISTK